MKRLVFLSVFLFIVSGIFSSAQATYCGSISYTQYTANCTNPKFIPSNGCDHCDSCTETATTRSGGACYTSGNNACWQTYVTVAWVDNRCYGNNECRVTRSQPIACGTQPSCTCGGWSTDSGCGGGGCASTQKHQSRTCTPVNCQSQGQCVADAACNPPSPSCSITLAPNPVTVIQGGSPVGAVATINPSNGTANRVTFSFVTGGTGVTISPNPVNGSWGGSTAVSTNLQASPTAVSGTFHAVGTMNGGNTCTSNTVTVTVNPSPPPTPSSSWWQGQGSDVVAGGRIRSQMSAGQTLITAPVGIAQYGGSSTLATGGQPVSTTNWQASTDAPSDFATNNDYTHILRRLTNKVTPNTGPGSPTAGSLTTGSPASDGIFYWKYAGSVTLPALNLANNKVVVISDGDVTLSGDIAHNSPQGLFVVLAKGNIIIAPAVQNLKGVYFAQGTVSTGISANLLTITGSTVGMTGVTLERTRNGATGPAELFVYDPNETGNLSPALSRQKLYWQEVAP